MSGTRELMLKQIRHYKKFVDKNLKWKREVANIDTHIHPNPTTVHFQDFTSRVDWIESFAKRKFKLYTISLLKQEPNMLIPKHTDTYYTFKKRFNVNNKVHRANIFLQDWKPGHYFEVNDRPYVKWKAGQYIMLDQTKPHRSGNIGTVNKYTAQVTGVLKN